MLDQLQEELISAMKAGDKPRMTGLRNIIGKLKASQIDKGEDLTGDESLKILKSAAKQLKESLEQYKKGGRDDLAEKELFELSLLDKYLPEQLSEDEIRPLVQEKIKSTGSTSLNDMGSIMGELMKALAGSVDGKLVKRIVEEELCL